MEFGLENGGLWATGEGEVRGWGAKGLGFEADELARHGVVEDLGVREDLARLPARHLRGGWGGGRLVGWGQGTARAAGTILLPMPRYYCCSSPGGSPLP